MDNRGDITLQGFLFSFLTAFLVISVFSWWIASSVNIYDITGYDNETLATYSNSANLTRVIEEQGNNVRDVTVDKNLFDWFSGIFDAVLTPLKTIIGMVETAYSMSGELTATLQLPPMFKAFFITAITIFIIIGIVLIKILLGRHK